DLPPGAGWRAIWFRGDGGHARTARSCLGEDLGGGVPRDDVGKYSLARLHRRTRAAPERHVMPAPRVISDPPARHEPLRSADSPRPGDDGRGRPSLPPADDAPGDAGRIAVHRGCLGAARGLPPTLGMSRTGCAICDVFPDRT